MTRHSLWRIWGATTLLVALGATAHAQTVYRIVGADGKVTFSDKPPATLGQGKVVGTGVGASGAASAVNLPFELRQVVTANLPTT